MAGDVKKLYRILWRWHFYAGLFCIPFIISLSITGAIYLFKPQIDSWIDRDFKALQIEGERSTPERQITAAINAVPGASFASYRLPESNKHAVVVGLKTQEGGRPLVYVHPYTQEVLKIVDYNDQFIRIVRALHGELMLGNVGSIIIELAGCWAIVLIFTGLYLWWPRTINGLAGIVYPRLSKNKRVFWRDLHAVTGFWVAIFTLFLLISGLPWALVWGTVFKEIRSIGKPAVSQDWQVSEKSQQVHITDTYITLTPALLKKAEALALAHPVEITPVHASPQQWKFTSQHQNRMLRANAWFNADGGELVKVKSFADRSNIDKVIGVGISAHEGHLFGWLNQLLGLLVVLCLLLVSISGFVLWRNRKPNDALGAPPVIPSSRVGKTVLGITLILALMLPVLAISIVVILSLEYLVIRHIAPLKNWLGLD